MATTTIGNAMLWLKADSKQMDKAVRKAARETSKILGGLGKAAQTAGKAMTVMGGVMVTALGKVAFEAVSFEKGMREVNTMMQLSQEEFEAFNKEVLDFSKRMGIDATDAVKALYQAISAGVPKENVIAFMEVAAKTAVGGVTDLETAVDGLTTVVNANHMEMSQATNVADIMFQIMKRGKTTIGEVSESLAQVAPIAATAGVSFEEVGGAIATLTKQGVKTPIAMTQIRAAIIAFMRPTKEFIPVLQKFGEELLAQGVDLGDVGREYFATKKRVDEFALSLSAVRDPKKRKELEKALEKMKNGLTELAGGLGGAIIKSQGLQSSFNSLKASAGENKNELAKMIGSVEAMQGVFALTGESAGMFAEDLMAMKNAGGSATAAFDEMEKSTARNWDRMMVQFKVLRIEIGEKLAPLLERLLNDYVRPLLQRFSDWIGRNPELTGQLVTLAAKIGALLLVTGPLVWYFGSLLQMTASLVLILPNLIKGIRALYLCLAPFVGTAGVLTLIVGAGIALGIGINRLIEHYFPKLNEWLGKMQRALNPVVMLWEKLCNLIDRFKAGGGEGAMYNPNYQVESGEDFARGLGGGGTGLESAAAAFGATPAFAPALAGAGGINISIAGLSVREEADVDRIARRLYQMTQSRKIARGRR